MSSVPPTAAVAALRQTLRIQEARRLLAAVTDPTRASGGPAAMAQQPGAQQPRAQQSGAVALGLPAVDAALPWHGLPAGGLHEICAVSAGGSGGETAAIAFAAFLAGRFQQAAGQQAARGAGAPVIWCRLLPRRQEDGLPYGPGLRACGLATESLVLAEARREEDLFWALEEALRDSPAAAVVGEVARVGAALPDVALRRLQLAAERSGRPLLLLRPDPGAAGRSCPSLTRWRIAARPSVRQAGEGTGAGRETAEIEAAEIEAPEIEVAGILPPPCWDLDLLRCRGGRPGRWRLHGTFDAASGASTVPDAGPDADDGPADDGPADDGKMAGDRNDGHPGRGA
ncbi:ImuA family protein [Marinibaculum pumilum]|uniref:ImuA family protein n=1 Tax=Marinibaculum pumilum TaxID=1766165 RepID=A0ABV7L8I9_9PROT